MHAAGNLSSPIRGYGLYKRDMKSSKNYVPTITVLLTTYNRAELLLYAIRSVLRQDFEDYELLILDDHSPDNTADIVASFPDKRMTYIRQVRRVGFTENFRTGIRRARGTYIFLLSDDDIILRHDTFKAVFQNMEKHKAGVGSMTLLFYDQDLHEPVYRFSAYNDTQFLPPSPENILKTVFWHFGFMSGNIYRRSLIQRSDIADDLWIAHLKPLYRALVSHGCVYLGNHQILGKISTSGNIAHLNVEVNKGYHLHHLLELYPAFDPSPSRYEEFKRRHVLGVAGSLPGIAYYSGRKNMIAIVREIIRIYPSILLYLPFWFFLMVSLSLPRSILGVFREIKLKNSQEHMQAYTAKIGLQTHVEAIRHFIQS